MSKTQDIKNQHYIPRSHLKNFGFLVSTYTRPDGKVDEKWSIHNVERGSEIKVNNTKKICQEEYLYDLPLVDEEYRQFIEKAYDKSVDRHFSEVTKFLCNPKNSKITSTLREKTLKCFLSLYFRTPKHLSIDIEKLKSDGYTLQEIQKFKTEKLENHITNFEKLYKSKQKCSICVNEAYGDYQYISGDNPVVYRHPS